MSKSQPEYNLQKQVCQWLNKNHPDILFLSDTIASVKLTMPQAKEIRRYKKKALKRLI